MAPFKKIMIMKSPSKFLSLNYLVTLRKNDYCNKDKGIDYVPSEVDDLIFEKQNAAQEEINLNFEKDQEKQFLQLQRKRKVKTCSCCELEKSFKEFHIDKSKKFFALRSHCKGCRALPELTRAMIKHHDLSKG